MKPLWGGGHIHNEKKGLEKTHLEGEKLPAGQGKKLSGGWIAGGQQKPLLLKKGEGQPSHPPSRRNPEERYSILQGPPEKVSGLRAPSIDRTLDDKDDQC